MESTIKATYKISSPMFLSGADKNIPELRPPSFKGALRFWWRAAQWGKALKDNKGDIKQAVRSLHAEESRVFGSVAKEKDECQIGGQGIFLLKIEPGRKEVKALTLSKSDQGCRYLLGQGIEKNTKYIDQSSGAFKIALRFKPERNKDKAILREDDIRGVMRALLLLGLLGGLGSRARKGFGSVSIQSLLYNNKEQNIPKNIGEFKQVFDELKIDSGTGLPPFTAFSSKSRIDVLDDIRSNKNAWSLLNKIGINMNNYRSTQKENNFYNDAVIMRGVVDGKKPEKLPERIVFGLPQNYFFISDKSKALVSLDEADRNRRASPLFIHTHIFKDGSSAIVQSFLPAIFVPAGDEVSVYKCIKPESDIIKYRLKADPGWDVIRKYMDEFEDRKEIFP